MSALKKYKKILKRWRNKEIPRLKKYIQSTAFARLYVKTTLVFLALSTAFWSYLGAILNNTNADQLVNPYMFESFSVFRNAMFPGQHTFLLKWPIFWTVSLLNNTSAAYITMTVLLSLVSVGLFAYILYRIERRPYVYGTLLMALASILFMIPAQAAPGMLLPVNMAMIANRNIEYIFFIATVALTIKARKVHSRKFYAGVVLLSLLIASDKLFLSTTIVGAVLALMVATLVKKWPLASSASRVLFAALISGIMSMGLLFAIDALHITHISQQASTTYGITNSLHTIGQNAAYAVTGTLTNFGAHPAARTTIVSEMPKAAVRTLFSYGGPITVINLLLVGCALFASSHVIRRSLRRGSGQRTTPQTTFFVLVCISIATLSAFIFTNHFAAGDARYLTMVLFTLFIGLTLYAREKSFSTEKIVLFGSVLAFVILFSAPSVLATTRLSKQSMSTMTKRNSLIVDALASHPVNVLVGDYWRVLPIRQASGSRISVMPLSDCTTARDVLSSLSWQPNLQRSSFAYILSSDQSATDYPSCTLDDITNAYGIPNASIVIAGSQDHPTEQLLFYDHGAHKSSPQLGTAQTATSPLSLDELPNTTCSKTTRVSIVAHEDDDLLFMNPGLQDELASGSCIRTIYLTAGDAGSNQFYWLSREQGSEAAYNHMIGVDALWIHRTVKLGDKQYITVANPRGNPRVSLIFFRLPDGNLRGNGFGGSGHMSIEKLYNGSIPSIRSVYNDTTFTKETLVSALTTLLHLYNASDVHTQTTINGPPLFDHSDHVATARFTDEAYAAYISGSTASAETTTISHYSGYSVRLQPENVGGDALQKKTETFLRYAEHDSGVCHSFDECAHTPTYGDYLRRQYTTD